ncbi:MAG: 16S rRNA (guanine(966)-N(2))-methyltransferase RsmD [Nitrospinota bacterium]
MRVVGGAARGLKLVGPGKIAGIRPTSDKLREALFNMIDVGGASFLDLFAGTGAVGCEAASRGALRVTMVENSAKALSIIKRNIAAITGAVGEETKIKIRRTDVMKFSAAISSRVKYDYIFCDPPYGWPESKKLISHISKRGLLEPGGVLIWEASKRCLPETEFEPSKVKRYGDTTLLFFEKVDKTG